MTMALVHLHYRYISTDIDIHDGAIMTKSYDNNCLWQKNIHLQSKNLSFSDEAKAERHMSILYFRTS